MTGLLLEEAVRHVCLNVKRGTVVLLLVCMHMPVPEEELGMRHGGCGTAPVLSTYTYVFLHAM